MTAEVKVELLQAAVRGLAQQLSLLTAKMDGIETYVGRVLTSFEDRMSREMRDEMAGVRDRLEKIEQKLDRILEKLP